MKMKHWLILAATLSSSLIAQQLLADDQPNAPASGAKPAVTDATPPAKSGSKKKSTAKKAAPEKKAATAPSELVSDAPLTPGPAVVKQNINVRGQPAITSEVVTRLKKGDRVTVLEEITLAHPKTDDPGKWAKIALPANGGVWVSTHFIDAASKTVVPKRLNLRSGPGENYSVLGRIEKGTVVKEIETKGDWIKIEAPDGTYAFVAAHFLAPEAAAPAPPMVAAAAPPKAATPTPPPPAVETPAPTPPPPPPAAPPTETTIATPPPPAVAEPVTPPPAVATPPPAMTVTPAAPPPPVVLTPAAPPTPVVTTPTPPEEEPKRVVTREGIVRSSVSIQAPTYFVLQSLDTGKAVNYLYSTNIALKDFNGRRIVVTGEELLDERWPNTPVITVDNLAESDAGPVEAPKPGPRKAVSPKSSGQ